MMIKNIFNTAIIVFVAALFCAFQAYGADNTLGRSNKFGIFALIQQMKTDSISGESSGLPITVEFDDMAVFGFGTEFGFHDHFGMSWDLFFGATDMIAEVANIELEGDTVVLGTDINLLIYLLKTPVTPVITAGIGYISFTGDWDAGSSSVDTTFSETNFSGNLGVGVRWDAKNGFFGQVLYRNTWTQLEDMDDSSKFGGISIALGTTF